MSITIKRRVGALERAQHPEDHFEVDGMMMGLAGAIAYFRRRAIAEHDRNPAAAEQRQVDALQRAEARRRPGLPT